MPHESGEEEGRLRVVDETAETEEVLRLDGGDATQREAPKRLKAEAPGPVARLEKAPGPEPERRSTEPDFDTLLDAREVVVNPEEEWQAEGRSQPVPYGWFVLILMGVGALVAMSLWRLTNSEEREVAEEMRQASLEMIEENEAEEAAAARDIEAIETTVRGYFDARSVDEMLPLVRDPERVEPLMRDWYSRHPMHDLEAGELSLFQPLEIEKEIYWLVSCKLRGQQAKRTVIIEQDEEGKARIDWETLVCYQPMDWSDYVRDRPEQPLDFRVYAEPDRAGFYAYEFSDEEKWEVYRLTARDSDDYLFGYVERGSEQARELAELCRKARRSRASPFLRLKVPDGSRSPRGVEIVEVLNERWMITDPRPETDAP